MEGYVKQNDLGQGIKAVEFYHPAHNSLPGPLLKQLADTINALSEDDNTKVVILKSGGDRTFCAGASFNELISINDAVAGKSFFMGFANVINACRKCSKFVIGRVQGKAVGGGVGLASAVDYCLATKFAAVKLSELNIGIGPFVIGPAVTRKIGLSAFSQLGMNANQFYSAEWAREKGLYAEVLESAEELDAKVFELAEYLANTNPEAQQKMKRVFWEGTDNWDELLAERAAMSGQLVLSEYTKNTLARFAEKMK